jgi:hypothetical protein
MSREAAVSEAVAEPDALGDLSSTNSVNSKKTDDNSMLRPTKTPRQYFTDCNWAEVDPNKVGHSL